MRLDGSTEIGLRVGADEAHEPLGAGGILEQERTANDECEVTRFALERALTAADVAERHDLRCERSDRRVPSELHRAQRSRGRRDPRYGRGRQQGKVGDGARRPGPRPGGASRAAHHDQHQEERARRAEAAHRTPAGSVAGASAGYNGSTRRAVAGRWQVTLVPGSHAGADSSSVLGTSATIV